VKRQSLKVQINATSDVVCMRYIRPSPSTKLEGFILGYGSSFLSNQYILLPSDGKSYIAEVDAEPRYLIAVRPARVSNYKKSCSGKTKTPKPLQLVIGTLSPTSVFLSWGILVNPKHDWTTMKNCANDRFYTVRYREKDKNKKWVLQLCPTTETVVDNLKSNTIYEFGVKDNTDNGIWSKIFNHKVAVSNKDKENGELQNNYKLPKLHTQLTPGDSKALVPITIIKQVHLLVPDFNRTQQKLPTPLTLDISERPKETVAMPELNWESNKPTVSSDSEEVVGSPAHTESELESSKPSVAPIAELPVDTLASYKFPELPKTKTSPIFQTPIETLDNAPSQPPLEQNTPKMPRITEQFITTPAEKEHQWENPTPKIDKKPELPRSTLAPSKTKIPVPQMLPHLEEPKIVPGNCYALSYNYFVPQC
ncbi:hypothetical protein lerEdw1_011327, partial [Lerista edwardsae]